MTLKEAFRAALELDHEDLLRLQDSISSVLEASAAKPAPEPQPVKTKVRRLKKQKPADKVQTAAAVEAAPPWQ